MAIRHVESFSETKRLLREAGVPLKAVPRDGIHVSGYYRLRLNQSDEAVFSDDYALKDFVPWPEGVDGLAIYQAYLAEGGAVDVTADQGEAIYKKAAAEEFELFAGFVLSTCDEIEGTELQLGDGDSSVWLHRVDQIQAWLTNARNEWRDPEKRRRWIEGYER